MDHGITTRRTGAEDVESRQGSEVDQHSRTRSRSRRRHVAPKQLVHVQQGRLRAAARRQLVVGSSWLIGGSLWLVQVLQVQHLQDIHTCREEVS